ncbi:hypothetical protein RFI_32477 [Reticulomyxa filosa]|uniref:Ubiquitin-like domain-containing protein n=1 Tax=Reticulomyxa filosa TaxID=46433 RepID=X6LW51_RETFI|nr:hypothetical protein RFI_32477 [Reticulomyxa filosa]|eukprot:ETO04920.1 hypothetical protein RFI_32477 [Reticulomyxa filosa]
MGVNKNNQLCGSPTDMYVIFRIVKKRIKLHLLKTKKLEKKNLEELLKTKMSLNKAFVTIGSKEYTLHLTNLTLEHLKEQLVEASKEDERGKVLTKITDLNGHDIETDQQLQNTYPLNVYAYFQSSLFYLISNNYYSKNKIK